MHKYSEERAVATAEVVADIIRLVREEDIPLPVLMQVREMVAEYETPTEYQVVMNHVGLETEG